MRSSDGSEEEEERTQKVPNAIRIADTINHAPNARSQEHHFEDNKTTHTAII